MRAHLWSRRTLMRACFGLLVVVLAGIGPVRAVAATDAASGLIRQLGDETLAVLDNSSASKPEQIQKMRSVFRRYFAVEQIGQFVLSRYWRKATPAQRTEYLNLFEDLIVYGYAQRFGGYAGERLEIFSTRKAPDGSVTVKSRVVSPDGRTNIGIDWQVETVKNKLLILDVVVEGVSLKLTQRSDFMGAIKQQGGSVEGLIELLREKTAMLKREAGG